jgi:chromosome segregation ATPase
VFNVLNCLLNYCAFVRHTYARTVLDLKGKLRERDELRMVKHQLLTDIEQAKIKEENNVKSIRDLDAKIPRQKSKIEELEEKEKRLREEITRIQAESEKSDLNLMEMKNELANIKSLAVSEVEMDSIISAKEVIEKQLEEQDQITFAGRQKLKENSHSIEEAQAITSNMETLHASFNIDASDIKTKKKEVEELKVEVNSFKSNISQLKIDIESLSQTLDMKNNNVTKLIKKRDEIKKSYTTKEAEQRKELKEKENLLRKLTMKEAALSATNQRLRDEQDLLFKVASNVIKHISNQIFEDNRHQD